jgi:hypothetical membrane protein
VGGWTWAAAGQSPAFDPIRSTISALAAQDADSRWVMTSALAVTGCCHVATAVALVPVRRLGRALLAAGGVATVGVAVFPLPSATGTSPMHTVCAAAAFALLAGWPFASAASGPWADGAWATRRVVRTTAGSVLVLLVLAFVAGQRASGDLTGLLERLAAGAQSAWPAAVAFSLAAAWRARARSRQSA